MSGRLAVRRSTSAVTVALFAVGLLAVGLVDRPAVLGSGARAAATVGSPPVWGPSEQVAARRATQRSDFRSGVVRVRAQRVVALWNVPAPRHRNVTLLRLSTRHIGGHWSRPRTVGRAPAGQTLNSYDVALGPRGSALVTWNAYDDANNRAHLMATRLQHGIWSRPHRFGGDQASDLVGWIDPNGVCNVVWVGSAMYLTSRPPQEDWGRARRLARAGGVPVVATNARGDVAVAWLVHALRGDVVDVITRSHGRSWSRVHRLHSVIGVADPPVMAVDPRGRVLVMWGRSVENEDVFNRRHLAWARTRLDGSWTRVRYLGTASQEVQSTSVSLSMNEHGRALALWSSWLDGTGIPNKASRFRFGHGWSRPRTLGGNSPDGGVFLARSGTAVAVIGDGLDGSTTWAYQQPGRPWHRRTLPMTSGSACHGVDFAFCGLIAADGAGQRWVGLFNSPALTARVLSIPPR